MFLLGYVFALIYSSSYLYNFYIKPQSNPILWARRLLLNINIWNNKFITNPYAGRKHTSLQRNDFYINDKQDFNIFFSIHIKFRTLKIKIKNNNDDNNNLLVVTNIEIKAIQYLPVQQWQIIFTVLENTITTHITKQTKR